jgi:hypothetical protein
VSDQPIRFLLWVGCYTVRERCVQICGSLVSSCLFFLSDYPMNVCDFGALPEPVSVLAFLGWLRLPIDVLFFFFGLRYLCQLLWPACIAPVPLRIRAPKGLSHAPLKVRAAGFALPPALLVIQFPFFPPLSQFRNPRERSHPPPTHAYHTHYGLLLSFGFSNIPVPH